jgi:hypothetical protein
MTKAEVRLAVRYAGMLGDAWDSDDCAVAAVQLAVEFKDEALRAMREELVAEIARHIKHSLNAEQIADAVYEAFSGRS